jgi:signal transduction histidine kinase
MQSYATRFSERTGIRVILAAPPAEIRLPQTIEVALYRVMQETLTNVARHAEAHRVDVRLATENGSAVLSVTDDGRGFDADTYLHESTPKHGMGILGMRERAEVYGGRLEITSTPGHGTEIQLRIPLTPTAASPEARQHVEDQRPAR